MIGSDAYLAIDYMPVGNQKHVVYQFYQYPGF